MLRRRAERKKAGKVEGEEGETDESGSSDPLEDGERSWNVFGVFGSGADGRGVTITKGGRTASLLCLRF
jgi:hypothetical protein